jgi:hypothetical protein
MIIAINIKIDPKKTFFLFSFLTESIIEIHPATPAIIAVAV